MRCLNDHLESLYRHYAHIVYRHPWPFLIGPVMLTLCFSTGFLLATDRMVNDTIYLVTPYDGRWRYEKASIMEKWPYDEENYVPGVSLGARHFINVIVTAKNTTAGLLNNETLDEVLRLDDMISNNFTLTTVDGESEFSYGDICLKYGHVCFGNGHVIGLRNKDAPIIPDPSLMMMHYPITREYLTKDPLHVGYLLGGVTVNKSDQDSILDVQAIRLLYFPRQYPIDTDTMSVQFRIGIQNYLLNEFRSDLIDVSFANEDSSNQGLIENAKYYAPQFNVAFVVMLTFSFLNSFIPMQRRGFIGIDWVRSKPLLACFGLTSPCLAIASTLGVMLFAGLPFHPFIVVMPFIVLAIGVNDMFIMMAVWHGTKKSDPPDVRFAETLSEAAVSVTITSVSDVVAFAIATWNDLPGIQLFCAQASLGFFFELLYQCTYYAAAIAIFAKVECEGKHCVTLGKTVPLEEARTTFQRRFLVGSVVPKPRTSPDVRNGQSKNGLVDAQISHIQSESPADPHPQFIGDREGLNSAQRLVRKYYVPALLHPCAKVVALLLLLSYLGMGIWGCTVMGTGLPPDKLAIKGHYGIRFLKLEYAYFMNGVPLQVTVGNPPNLTTSEGRMRMLELVKSFENTTNSLDSSGTLFWMRDYINYLNETWLIEDTREQWCDDLKDWLHIDTKGTWVSSIKWANESEGADPCKIDAFRFMITTKNFGMVESSIITAVPLFRGIADRYPEYNVTTYADLLYAFADQYLNINWTMLRNGLMAFLAMIIISMLMIPHPVCAIFIALSTASIDTGVLGFLGWWGINVDGLTMTNMIMATGFAVDLSAHVSYAYVRSQGSVEEKVRHSLEELGWPVFQGVTSTLLGVFVLGLIDSYMYQIFFKTIFLVILFGILHSLFFLPVALTVFAPRRLDTCMQRRRQPEKTRKYSTAVTVDNKSN